MRNNRGLLFAKGGDDTIPSRSTQDLHTFLTTGLSMVAIRVFSCSRGMVLPLHVAEKEFSMPSHWIETYPLPDCGSDWRVGTCLYDEDGVARLKVVGRIFSSYGYGVHGQVCPLLEALTPLDAQTLCLEPRRQGWSLAWITLSDKGASGQRQDESGPLISRMVREVLDLCHERGDILPDDVQRLRGVVMELTVGHGYDVVVTTGGTGLSPRDVTPEAILPLLDRRLPGIEQAMMQTSLQKTPRAMLSRLMCGTIGRSLVLALPGSRKAVEETLGVVLPALNHALEKLHGDPSDCGGEGVR